MTYTYKDPLLAGYRRAHLPSKVHDRFFRYRKRNWKTRVEYYVREDRILVQYFVSWPVAILCLLAAPLVFALYGLANSEVWGEYRRMLNQRKYGSFQQDDVAPWNPWFSGMLDAMEYRGA